MICLDGQMRAHSTDCTQFSKCVFGLWINEACPDGHFFDLERKMCLLGDADAMCPGARSSECFDGMLPRASEGQCTKYYGCENNKWLLKECPMGQFFDGHEGICSTNASPCARNNAMETTKSNRCSLNETRTSNTNCGIFYVCYEGEWWYRHCIEGSYFNKSLEACIPNDGTCRLSFETSPCKNGTVRKSDFDPCIAYHLCVDGNWTLQHCPIGHHFNETRRACMLDDEDKACINVVSHVHPSCVDGTRRHIISDCREFEVCSFGQWLQVRCHTGFYFDTGVEMCITNRGECLTDGSLRRECVDNESRQSHRNCSEFYHCSRNQWHLENCARGHQYNETMDKCVATNATCISNDMSSWPPHSKCVGKKSGTYMAHDTDCSKYQLCVDDLTVEAACSVGRFYDQKSKSCLLNEGECPIQVLTDDICDGKSDGSYVQNPANCSTFYTCIGNTALLSNCPAEHYFNSDIGACQTDTGVCNKRRRCADNTTTHWPHETYCNIYYTCVRGVAIPIACEDDELFDPVARKCSADLEHRCVDGLLVPDEICTKTDSDKALVDPDNCTSYIICANGVAQKFQCPEGHFFDAKILSCAYNNGTTCPYIDDPNNSSIPGPHSCTGKHGDLMADPEHCNEFYVCIYGSLRHERCFDGDYFNVSIQSCAPMTAESKCPTDAELSTLCATTEDGTNFADQTDCRKYYQCNDGELQSKKCRTGESFDTLLDFCRQNDGTCLLENGQRVGACAGKHGKLAADAEHCRGYFTCINGQKISEECGIGEYFDKMTKSCERDVNSTCKVSVDELDNPTELSCAGLNELVFYPNAIDDCKTFFQCVKGIPRMHNCPDDLLFNYETGTCDWKDYVKCVNRTNHHQRDEVCVSANNGTRYVHTADNCDSYFICTDGKLKSIKCDQGHKYNVQVEKCDLAANVNCSTMKI